jgi:FMN phosphatase YigB (HAD superfamily)
LTITYIFFDLLGTLVDSALLSNCYPEALGRVMAERYAGSADAWTQAYRRIVADWENYYADLDLDGEEGLADLLEGELRVTRALFRLTGTREPDQPFVIALARELPFLAARTCEVLYPDARSVIEHLHKSGFVLGVATHVLAPQTRGILMGAGVLPYFQGQLLCPDLIEHFRKDVAFYQSATVALEHSLVVDDALDGIRGAQAAGMQTVHISRDQQPSQSRADFVLDGNLDGLIPYLQTKNL